MKDLSWNRIGLRIQTRRLEKHLTQQNLAEKANLSDVYIGYIEQGKRKASVNTLFKITEILGCTINDLLTENSSNPESASALDEAIRQLLADCSGAERLALFHVIQSILEFIRAAKEDS